MDAKSKSFLRRGRGSLAREQSWLRLNRIKIYPKECGESLSVVANSEIVRLRSYHFDDVFIKLSLFFLKGRNKISGLNSIQVLLESSSGFFKLWQFLLGGRVRLWEVQCGHRHLVTLPHGFHRICHSSPVFSRESDQKSQIQ